MQFCNAFCIFIADMTTDQALERLFSKRAWYKNSGIGGSTARSYKKRFLDNKLDLEAKMKILRVSGFDLVQEMQWKENVDADFLRRELFDKLLEYNAFWSYDLQSIVSVSDEILIENVLLHLDLEEISLLFRLFPTRKIKRIWKERMLRREPLYHNLNILYAFLFFRIKDPDRYIRQFVDDQNRRFYERIEPSN